MSQATLLGRVPGHDPDRTATFFREQLEGHAFITHRPVVLVSGVDPDQDGNGHRHLVDELHRLVDRIWILSPAGWSLSQKSAEVNAASGELTVTHRSWRDRGEQFWPLLAGALVFGCDGHDPKRGWVALSKADAAAEWSGALVLTPVSPRPPSEAVPTDEEAQVYRPYVQELYRLFKGSGARARLAVVRGFPGVGKKYLYYYLVSRGAVEGGRIPGWGNGDKLRPVKVCSLDIELEDDYACCGGGLGTEKPPVGENSEPRPNWLRRRVDQIQRVVNKERDGLLLIYDHVIKRDDAEEPEVIDEDNLAGGGPRPRRLLQKLKVLKGLCKALYPRRDDLPNWYVLYFSASMDVPLDGLKAKREYRDLLVEWNLAGRPDVLQALYALHARHVPVRIDDLASSVGGYAKYADRLLLEARCTYPNLPGGALSEISRQLLCAAWRDSPWLQNESKWFLKNLKAYINDKTKDQELIEAIGREVKKWAAGDRSGDVTIDLTDPELATQVVLPEDRRGLIDQLRAYGIFAPAGSADRFRLLTPLLTVDPDTPEGS